MDSEQLFDSTQETAYRLCVHDPVVDNISVSKHPLHIFGANPCNERVFSSQWDPNNNRRLYTCTHSGRLYVSDFEYNRISSYHIIFQPYSSGTKQFLYDQSSDEKIISYHWDKLCLIPGRPQDMIFLIGVSNKIMYTSLPTPLPTSSKVIPHTIFTNKDVSDFIYGSPVLELYAHRSRVMSMSVSTSGHVLATGCEDGIIKLLSIQLLDLLSATDHDTGMKSSSSLNNHGMAPVYKMTRKIHDGPIFAMHWIDTYQLDDSNEYRHILATGSNDRMIHLWTVISSNDAGIQLYPLLNLSTISVNVLCITNMISFDPVVESHNDDMLKSKFIPRHDHARIEALHLPSPWSYDIAAGSHLGTIYTWRIDKHALLHAVNTSSMMVDVDDGRFLHTLIVSNDRPIISISLSRSTLSHHKMLYHDHSHKERIIMSVSDTLPSIKLYFEPDILMNSESSRCRSWREGYGPLAFLEEIMYDIVVISSAFIAQEPKDTSHDNELVNELSIVTMDGKILNLEV